MALTQIQAGSIEPGAINTTDLGANVTATYATYAAVAANLTPRITTVNVANSSYTVLDDTSLNTSGGFLVITGSNFQSGAIVTIDTTNATSTTFINSTTLRAQTASKTAGSYNLYVTNPDGGTAIKVLGVSYSNTPIWGTAATLSNQAANTAFAVNISANSDSNVTYSNTTSLPAGTTLLANGLFYGTVTIGAETVYTFTVNAVDAELQDTPREFSLTVTVGPPPGGLYTWGIDEDGSLGRNVSQFTASSSPVQVGSALEWSSVKGFYRTWVGIKSNGTLWMWGLNGNGQLGNNNTINRSSPIQVGSSTNWKSATVGRLSCLAVKTDGTLWTWGTNSQGVLGLNENSSFPRSSPTQIGSGSTWLSVNVKYYAASAIKTDGTLWTWGIGDYGVLGLNSVFNVSSPTQVGTGTNWSSIKGQESHTLALKTDGTLWTWGRNQQGQLGLNNITYLSSPVQIGTSTNWSKISGGRHISQGVKTDGTLWSWGMGMDGGLGLGNELNRSSPTQVGTGTDWSLSESGRYRGFAIKTDGTLWAWGAGGNGMLGNSATTNRVSPVQVSGTTWQSISSADGTTAGIKT